NKALKFVSRDVHLRVETVESRFTGRYQTGAVICLPVAHGAGNYHAGERALAELRDEDRIAFRYCRADGSAGGNPNGSADDIAGVLSANRRVLGMMPLAERRTDPVQRDPVLGSSAGAGIFGSLVETVTTA
ncbi:MAG TPA: phosphoribosylformylglycinamidine synthase subunit PurQ, partial [Paracoccaceae bacterium]|nr:phosphoribosylformylglycinamidine synthase subunit PurQ [Paracoccaceae bacterium]